MATKTISLELDAYEKLRRAKRGGESFSAVVRRARLDGAELGSMGEINEPAAGYGALEGSVEKTPVYWDRFDAKERLAIALDSFDAASARQDARNKAWKGGLGDSPEESGRSWTREELYKDRLQ